MYIYILLKKFLIIYFIAIIVGLILDKFRGKLNGYDLTENTKLPELNLFWVPLVLKVILSIIIIIEINLTFLIDNFFTLFTTLFTNIFALYLLRKMFLGTVNKFLAEDKESAKESKLCQIFSNTVHFTIDDRTLDKVILFSKEVKEKFRSKKVTWIAILIYAFIISPDSWVRIFHPYTNNIFGSIEIAPTQNFFYWVLFVLVEIQGFTLYIFLIWMVLIFVIFTYSLGKIDRYTEHEEIATIIFDKNVDIEPIFKHSIRSFRRSTKVIADLYLRFTLMAILGVLVLDFTVLAINFVALNSLVLAVSFLIANIVIVFVFIISFLTPQISSKNIMNRMKTTLLNVIDMKYQTLLQNYLKIEDDLNSESRQAIIEEIRFLEEQGGKIEKLLVWPFNYTQVVALFTSGIISIITGAFPFVTYFILDGR